MLDPFIFIVMKVKRHTGKRTAAICSLMTSADLCATYSTLPWYSTKNGIPHDRQNMKYDVCFTLTPRHISQTAGLCILN